MSPAHTGRREASCTSSMAGTGAGSSNRESCRGRARSRRNCAGNILGLALKGHHALTHEAVELAQKRIHFKFPQEGARVLTIQRLHGELFQRLRAAVGVQAGELPVQEHGLFVAFKLLADGGRHLGHAVAHVLKAAEVAEQLFRRLFAYALHAGHVVGSVADKRLHVRPLGGLKTGFRAEGIEGEQLFLAGGGIPHDHLRRQALDADPCPCR